MNTTKQRAMAAVVTAALVAAACGGDDDDSQEGSADATEPEVTTTDTAEPEVITADTTEPELITTATTEPEVITTATTEPEVTITDTTEPETSTSDEDESSSDVHDGPDCYVRRDRVVTLVGQVEPETATLFGLTKITGDDLGPLLELIPGSTEASAAEIASRIDIFTPTHDALATVVALRNEDVESAAPVAMAAFAGHWTFLPGRTGPAEPSQGIGPVDLGGGSDDGPLIAIADTGLLRDLPPDFEALRSGTDVVDLENDLEDVGEFGERIGGHGTFVASILRQALPEARMRIAKVHRVAATDFVPNPPGEGPDGTVGVSDELQVFDAIVRLSRSSNGEQFAGLNLSLGALACPELIDPLRLAEYLADNAEAFDELVDPSEIDLDKVVSSARDATKALSVAIEFWDDAHGIELAPVFASAGNEGDDFEFAPALFGDVVDVAADVGDSSKTLSCFSAPGQTSEVGENVVGVGLFAGSVQLVTWSGTSFSSPVALAQRLGGQSPIVVDDNAPPPC